MTAIQLNLAGEPNSNSNSIEFIAEFNRLEMQFMKPNCILQDISIHEFKKKFTVRIRAGKREFVCFNRDSLIECARALFDYIHGETKK